MLKFLPVSSSVISAAIKTWLCQPVAVTRNGRERTVLISAVLATANAAGRPTKHGVWSLAKWPFRRNPP
jgi:hypothetical protein